MLPVDLQEIVEDHERVTGARRCESCPWSRQPSPWSRQVLQAQRLAVRLNGSVTVRSSLGRDPHVWDLAALDALLLAQADAEDSDRTIAERERAQTPQNPK